MADGRHGVRRVRLGATGPEVSALGLGCWGMTSAYGPVDPGRSRRTVRAALRLGITAFDTSDNYGEDGANEREVGAALRGVRDDVVVITKFGSIRQPDGSTRSDGRPEHVRRACEASLARLEIEVIDVYLQHRVDPQVPIEETVGAMAQLVAAGKVRHIGLCEAGPERIRAAHAVHPLAVVQSELSLWSRDVEVRVLGVLRELRIALMAYSPLGRGFLAGRVRTRSDLAAGDVRSGMPRFSDENLPVNLRVLARLDELARSLGVTSAQLALAWVLGRGDDIVAIPGTTDPDHLAANVAAMDVTVPAEVATALDGLAALTAGARSAPQGLAKLES